MSIDDRIQQEARKFFDEHKEEEWFLERYDPNLVQAQRDQLIQRAQKEAEAYAEKLEAGELKPCYDFVEHQKESKVKTDEIEEGEAQQKKHDGEEKAEDESLDKTKDAETGEQDKSMTAAEDAEADVSSTTIFIKVVPPNWKRAELQELLQSACLKFSEPIASKDWCRTGWANYDTPQQCAEAFERCKSSSLGGVTFELALTPANRIRHTASSRPKILSRAFADERRITHDLQQARLLVQHLDLEKGLVPNELLTSDQAETQTIDLDRVILYLRQVHLFDYYAGEEFVEMADLERRSPAGNLRGLAPDREVEHRNITKQEMTLDSKIRHRLENKWALDERAALGKLDNWNEKFLEQHTLKVEENKFGCTFSTKLFMAPEFVHKHIINKHASKMQDAKDKAYKDIFFDSYRHDPVRPRNPGAHNFGPMQAPPPHGFGKGGFGGKGFKGDGFGWGKGGFKGKGKGFGDYERFRGRSPPYRRGRSPPRGRGGGLGRAMRSYNDLDAADDVVAPIDFEELDALEAQLGGLSDNEGEQKEKANEEDEGNEK